LFVDAFVQAHDYSRASRVRRLLRERFAHAFLYQRIDLIATPTTPIAAVPAEQWSVTFADAPPEPVGLTMLRLTAPANLTGLPAISVPAGFVQTGMSELPFGLQLMARPFQEPLLLQAAHLLEQSTAWHQRRPPDLDA
jgi:aspartyl-tRNA(Asn)/glutamyl-tRNA(Gln) amidotransferase subunit A